MKINNFYIIPILIGLILVCNHAASCQNKEKTISKKDQPGFNQNKNSSLKLPENWILNTTNIDMSQNTDSYGNPIINQTNGLPDWSIKDIQNFKQELSELLNTKKELTRKNRRRNLIDKDNTNQALLYEINYAIGNFIGQALIRKINISQLITIDHSLETDIAKSCAEYFRYYENEKYIFSKQGLYKDGDGPFGAYDYNRTSLCPSSLIIIEISGYSIRDILNTDNTLTTRNSRAVPSGNYYETTQSTSMSYISGASMVFDGTSSTYDDQSSDVPIGFNFKFYECDDPDNNTSVRLSTNGYFTFFQQGEGTLYGTDYSNDIITSASDPDGFVAPIWDDLKIHNLGSTDKLTYKTEGTVGNRVFTAEWYSVSYYNSTSAYIYAQGKLYEATGMIELCYGIHSGTSFSFTSGIENYTGTDGDDGAPGASNQYSSYNYKFQPQRPPTNVTVSGGNTACSGGGFTLTPSTSGGFCSGCSWQYQWLTSGGIVVRDWSTTSSYYAAPSSTTAYICRVRCSCNNCNYTQSSNSTTVTIVPDPIAPSITRSPNSNPVCEGTNLTIITNPGSGGTGSVTDQYRYYNGSWSSWSTSTPSFSATTGVINSYQSRRIATGTGCNDSPTNQVNWTVDQAPTAGTVSTSTNNLCIGSTVTFDAVGYSGTFETFEYKWNAGGATHDWVNSDPYTWTANNPGNSLYVRSKIGNGTCTDVFSPWSTPVFVNSSSSTPTSISISNNNTCFGTNKTLTVNGGSLGTGASWEWYTGSCGGTHVGSGNSITVNPAAGSSTTYYVRAEGTCNTTSCANATVTVLSTSSTPASISVSNNNTCFGTNKTLTVNGGSLGTGASWEWYTGSCGGIHVGSGNNITVNPAAGSSTTYYVRAEGTCNTTSCANAIVTVLSTSSAPTSISISNNNTCFGTNKTLTVNGGSLGTGASWEWYTGSCGGTHVGSGNSITVNPAAGSSTTYYVRAEGTCNTTSCKSATITVLSNSTAPISINITNNSTCNGINKTLSVNGGSLGAGANWEWYSGSCGGIHVGSGNNISVDPPSGTNTTYYVRAEGTCNNTSCISNTVTVLSDPGITSVTANSSSICNNATTLLTANGVSGSATTITWHTGPNGTGTNLGTGNSISVAPGTYYARVTGSCSPPAESNITINGYNIPSASPNFTNNPICSGTSTLLNANAAAGSGSITSYTWDSGITGNNSSGNVSSAGIYSVTITNSNGCTNSASSPSLSFYTPPTANPSFTSNPICAGNYTTLSANANQGSGVITTYNWSSGISGNSASGNVSENGVYTVTVTDINGCTVSANSPSLGIQTPSTTSIVSGDYIWAGYLSSQWQTSGNWIVYNGADFTTAIAPPDNLKNVFIRDYASCVSNAPVTNINTDVFCNNLTIESTLSLGANSKLNIKGNFLNSGNFISGTGTVIFNGINLQSITSNNDNFYNVEFDNSAGNLPDFKLLDDLSITHELVLTEGIIDANSNTVYIHDGATSNSGNENCFIDGEISRTGTTEFTYPTGDIADIGSGDRGIWAPVKTDACALSTIIAQYFYENPPYDWWYHNNNMDITIDHVTDREYWDLTTDNATPAVSLFWTDNTDDLHSFGTTSHTEMTSTFVSNSLTIAHYNVSLQKWEDMGSILPTTIYFDDGELKTNTPFSSYSPITFASKRPDFQLPVELIYFKASCHKDEILISWSSATETNNEYYLLEKSSDAIIWNSIGKIEGAGDSQKTLSYNFTDHSSLTNQKNYYRLSQYDFDGKHKVCGIISSQCYSDNKSPEFTIFPNPFNNEINITCTNWDFEGKTEIIIHDLTGKTIKTVEANINFQTFHKVIKMNKLTTGLYLLEIRNKEYSKCFKIQKR